MSTGRSKHASWIHECINLVRNRRSAFSDLDRICRIMLKCHGVRHEDTVRELEAMVSEGVVSRRAFKGVISYRNAGTKMNLSTGPGRSSRVARWIHEALKELDAGNGVGWMDIEKWVMTTHPYYHNMKGKIKGALKEDLDIGKIWQVSEGKYRLLEAAESPEMKIPDRSLVCDFCLQTAESNRKGEPEDLLICRDCGNRAHPSCMDYSVELTARIRADGGSWQCIDCKACVLCQDSGDPSSLLFCDACDKGYHMQCHTPKLQSMPTGKWACFNCVSTLSPEEVRASIHAQSTFIPSTKLQPPLRSAPDNTIEAAVPYAIHMSVEETLPVDVVGEIMSDDTEPLQIAPKLEELAEDLPAPPPQSLPLEESIVSVVMTSPVQPQPVVEQSNIVSSTDADRSLFVIPGEIVAKPKIPVVVKPVETKPKNAFHWEKGDVVEYIRSIGFPKEATMFAEQEIDGPSLMVMSRSDLVSALQFKLGPALKIYANVAKLQVQTLPLQ